jgi:glucose dehydrogenase
MLHRRARRQDRPRVWRTKTIAQPGSPGDDSWHGLPAEKLNGGSVWTSGSYDPALNLVYWGTGGPIPHSEIVRGTGDGTVLYTDSTLALDADTGKIVWYHQFLPRDNWNLDHVFEQVLADIEVDGHPRQVLLTIGKPGIIWALDRRTGEFLWERETSYQTVYKHIDAETGQVVLNESLIPQKLDETKFVCPSFYGGKLWMANAYDPASKTLFVPLNNLCMDYKTVAQEPLPGEDYGRGRMVFRHAPNNNGNIGRVDAVGVEKTNRPNGRKRDIPIGRVRSSPPPAASCSAATPTAASSLSTAAAERSSGSCRSTASPAAFP